MFTFMFNLILVVGAVIALIALIKGTGHNWEYRSPYARKCLICRTHQNVYAYQHNGVGWWETMYPLQTNTIFCGENND